MHSVCKRGCVGKKDLRFQIPSVGALITPNQLAWVFSKRTERGRNCSGRKSQTCFGSICLSHRQPVRHVRCRKTPDARRKTQGARHLCSRIHIRPDTCKKINVPVLRSLCCYVLLHLHTTLMYQSASGAHYAIASFHTIDAPSRVPLLSRLYCLSSKSSSEFGLGWEVAYQAARNRPIRQLGEKLSDRRRWWVVRCGSIEG